MKFGREALQIAGFPHEFAAQAMLASFNLKVSLAIRVGQPPNTNKGYEVSFKPMSLKTKTSSDEQGIPLVAGFIPSDQATFGRPHSKPIPKEGFSATQLKVSLRELLSDTVNGKYKMTESAGHLEFKATHADDPIRQALTFRVNLNDYANTQPRTINVDTQPWREKNTPKQPNFWDEAKFGKYLDQTNRLYSVEYQTNKEAAFQPLNITADKSGKPVTGDADKLWDAIPLEFATEMSSKLYSSSDPGQLSELITDYILLRQRFDLELDLSDEKSMQEIEAFAKTAGLITPYEMLLATVVNQEFNKVMPQFNNMFQHGAETANPGPPSDINSTMLHFHKGLAVLTENEKELVEFVKQPGYLNEHYFPIHHGWNMALWGEVVKIQLDLALPVPEKTLAAYNSYLAADKVAPPASAATSSRSSTMKMMAELNINSRNYAATVTPAAKDAAIVAPTVKAAEPRPTPEISENVAPQRQLKK